MDSPEWKDCIICFGLIAGTTLGVILSFFFGVQLTYGIASGAMLGYVGGLATSIWKK
ncbi:MULTISPECIES: hypothetical protein [unclassified Exiguobacterium]|uniref:hypothetical protein n=1 Tax=unclassified Exiguobacterium TaxID=2644629 RepID=UPI001BE96E43|nr:MULTISPECIES: hypothetical protein [unclassified Exiguobacterium]